MTYGVYQWTKRRGILVTALTAIFVELVIHLFIPKHFFFKTFTFVFTCVIFVYFFFYTLLFFPFSKVHISFYIYSITCLLSNVIVWNVFEMKNCKECFLCLLCKQSLLYYLHSWSFCVLI